MGCFCQASIGDTGDSSLNRASLRPPHVTLAGSLPLAVAEADLVAAVRDVARTP